MLVPGTDAATRLAVSLRGFEEVWDERDPEAIDRLFAEDFRGHGFPFGLTLTRARHKRFVTAFQRAFPDCEIVAEEVSVDDEFVYTTWRFTGTHTGTVGGLPPSGEEVTFEGQGRHRHRGDRIHEIWVDVDWRDVCRQILGGYVQAIVG